MHTPSKKNQTKINRKPNRSQNNSTKLTKHTQPAKIQKQPTPKSSNTPTQHTNPNIPQTFSYPPLSIHTARFHIMIGQVHHIINTKSVQNHNSNRLSNPYLPPLKLHNTNNRYQYK